MAKILVAWELGAGTGHCVNLLPIVKGLLLRGHAVYAAVRDLQVARSVFGDASITYFQAPISKTHNVKRIDQVTTFAEMLHNVGFGSKETLETLVSAWRSLFQLIKPDLLLAEHAPAALFTSRLYHMRRIAAGTGFFCPPDIAPLPPFLPELSREGTMSQVYEEQLLQRMNLVLQDNQAAPLARVSQLYAAIDETFLLAFAELDHYSGRMGIRHWGMWSPPGGVEPRWPDAKGPRIYAYLQPPASRWHPSAALMALRESGLPSLVYAPGVAPKVLKSFASPNIHFETQRLDMAKVRAQCSAAITHGNNGTVTQLLLGGVPQLHLPLFVEQGVFCQRVVQLGAALTAEIDRPDRIAAQLISLLQDNQYSAAATSFAKRYQNYDAEAVMVEVVTRIDDLSH